MRTPPPVGAPPVEPAALPSTAAARLFAGPGEMRARCRALDWTATPLGPVDRWPAALGTAVRICLASGFPMAVLWGPELAMLYNDAYRAVLGAKHPGALGRPARAAWGEIWAESEPQLARVMAGGPAVWHEDQPLAVARGDGAEVGPAGGHEGGTELATFTYSLSPLPDDASAGDSPAGDGPAVGGVLVTVVETTARVRAEAALRASEERQAFLLGLSDAMRPLADPGEIQGAAAQLLGAYLGANQVHYGETVGDGDEAAVVIAQGYGHGLPPMVGTFRARDFGERLVATYRAGRTVVCHDVATDPTVTAAEAAVITGAGFRSYVAVPLVKAGRWVATLAAHGIAPRPWTADEVALVEETAERTWAAVERARAEEAVRVSERRARLQNAAFEAAINGEPLARSLNTLARIAHEELGRDVRTAFYLAYPDGASLHAIDGAGDMPGTYTGAVDGFPVSDASFCSGEAIATGRPALTRDVRDDPRWRPYLGLASAHEIRAASSYPILTAEGRAIGSFALYFRDPHDATPREFAAAAAVTQAAAIILSRHTEVLERARAEAALRESEARLAAVFEALPVGIGVVDPDGQVVLANRALGAWLPTRRMPSRDAATAGRWQAWHPDGTPVALHDFPGARALRGEPTVPGLEMRYTGDDGRATWTQVAGVPVRDARGHVTSAVTTIHDIDALKRTAEALRASEARARALVATLPGAAVFVFDRDLRYALAGGEAFGAAGFTPEAFVGRTVGEVLEPALAAEYALRIRPVFAGEPFEWEHAAHGRVFLSRGVPLREDASGAPAGGGVADAANHAVGPVTAALVVSVDVTARRAAEEARQASEARYRTLVENVPDYAIFLLDADGRITEWPEGARRVKGYAPAEVVGRHVALFYTPEERAAGAAERELAEAARAGRAEREQWRVRKDGTRFWANEVATAVHAADGTLLGFTKISRDLTERRLAQEAAERAQLQAARDALRRALAQAEEAERQRLARELHDQLGQELTAFRLGLDDALRLAAAHDGAGAGPGAALPARLAQLQALAQRMTAGARYLALELRPPELDDVGLESALETYVAEWGARYGVAAEVAVTGLRGRALLPDVTSTLYRIAQEALTNVAKHAHAAQVSVIVEQPDGEVRLIVEDDGRGFDPDATAVRVRAERRLGLAGMRERAALVGGTVAVESSPGAGTTIYVRLPVDPPAESPGGAPGAGAEGAA